MFLLHILLFFTNIIVSMSLPHPHPQPQPRTPNPHPCFLCSQGTSLTASGHATFQISAFVLLLNPSLFSLQLIYYYMCSTRGFGANHFKIRNFTVVAIEHFCNSWHFHPPKIQKGIHCHTCIQEGIYSRKVLYWTFVFNTWQYLSVCVPLGHWGGDVLLAFIHYCSGTFYNILTNVPCILHWDITLIFW